MQISGTTQELVHALRGQNDLSERELLLIDRLQTTLDEVDALERELAQANLNLLNQPT